MARETLELARTPGAPLEDDVTRVCLDVFCLGETVAVRLFKELRQACDVPAARRVLDRVLRDEVRHRDFGWALLGWLLESPALGERLRRLVAAELPASIARIRGDVRAGRRGAGRGPSRRDDARWGLMAPARYGELLRMTFDRDYVPRFARLGIDARAAWAHAGRRPDVARRGTNEAPLRPLLDDVRAPPGDAPHGEGGRERLARQADRVEEDRRVELDVRAQRTLRVARAQRFLGRVLDGPGEGEAVARVGPREALDLPLEHRGPRIAHPVDAVAHAHDAPPGVELPVDPRPRALWRADGVEHVEHRPRRAAVQRALERADRRDHGRDHVRPGRGHDPRGEGRRVHPVVDDGHEVRVERARPVGRRVRAHRHPQEVRRVTPARIGRRWARPLLASRSQAAAKTAVGPGQARGVPRRVPSSARCGERRPERVHARRRGPARRRGGEGARTPAAAPPRAVAARRPPPAVPQQPGHLLERAGSPPGPPRRARR